MKYQEPLENQIVLQAISVINKIFGLSLQIVERKKKSNHEDLIKKGKQDMTLQTCKTFKTGNYIV